MEWDKPTEKRNLAIRLAYWHDGQKRKELFRVIASFLFLFDIGSLSLPSSCFVVDDFFYSVFSSAMLSNRIIIKSHDLEPFFSLVRFVLDGFYDYVLYIHVFRSLGLLLFILFYIILRGHCSIHIKIPSNENNFNQFDSFQMCLNSFFPAIVSVICWSIAAICISRWKACHHITFEIRKIDWLLFFFIKPSLFFLLLFEFIYFFLCKTNVAIICCLLLKYVTWKYQIPSKIRYSHEPRKNRRNSIFSTVFGSSHNVRQ